jgi:hypothetical protein
MSSKQPSTIIKEEVNTLMFSRYHALFCYMTFVLNCSLPLVNLCLGNGGQEPEGSF